MYGYKIKDGRYVAEEIGDEPQGDYISEVQVDCTLFMPDENGAPVLFPVPEPPPPEPEPYTPTPEEQAAMVLRELSAGVDAYMDQKARAKNYNDRFTFALRAAIPNSPWHQEGLVFAEWMDQVNAYCYSVLDAIKAGTRKDIPTLEQLIDELPALSLE